MMNQTVVPCRASGVTLHGLNFNGCNNGSLHVIGAEPSIPITAADTGLPAAEVKVVSSSFTHNTGENDVTGGAITICNRTVLLDMVDVAGNSGSSAILATNSSVQIQHSTLTGNGYVAQSMLVRSSQLAVNA
jgi:hypothetical protein